ncbi:hypothetical protein E0J16_25840 [Rhizobium pisi]|uniref:hypothetical protein n=1 Tax=Rhizobium pisi TaxID=574561 RepID=UPI00103D687D|nr:hypothetical protein [Rhizobium pisi]TCA48554.1 hypothetical protein E0J16_25840 [Rhizobium pisi]
MSITSPDDRLSIYNPVVATTDFAAQFPIFDNADLGVQVDGVDGVDFTVSATYTDGVSNDATVVFSPGITGEVVVYGKRDPRRSNTIPVSGPIPARDLNLAFDTLEIEMQERKREMDGAIRAPVGETGYSLGSGLANGDTLMIQGKQLVKGANAADITNAQASATAAAGSATAAATSASAAAGSATAAATSAAATAWRVFADVATATAATIPSTATYIAIASYSPVPRFYKRFVADPGGDRFQSADGAWWQGLPLPGTSLDFANPVARAGNVTFVTGDLDQVHLWTIGAGTTYTGTLMDPDTCIGRILHVAVSPASRGLLALACVDPIGLFVTGDLVLWAGESMTLIARAGRWEIIGGRCIPCALMATCPGLNVTVASATVSLTTQWVTSQGGDINPGAEWAINGSGQIIVPRKGFYQSFFDVGISWAVVPTYAYASCDSVAGLQSFWGTGTGHGSGANAIMHASDAAPYTKGKLFAPKVTAQAGNSVGIDRQTLGAPLFKLIETPQW